MVGQRGQKWSKVKKQPSKEEVLCIVPECGKKFRRDKLNDKHYVKVVKVDASNKPFKPGSTLFNRIEDESIKIHTEYFYKNKLDPSSTKESLPSGQPSSSKISPFEEMERRRLMKRTQSPTNGEQSSPRKISRKLELVILYINLLLICIRKHFP